MKRVEATRSLQHGLYTGTLNYVVSIEKGSGGEGPHAINPLINEPDQGYNNLYVYMNSVDGRFSQCVAIEAGHTSWFTLYYDVFLSC